jgi:hypothetical protein
VLGTFFFSFFSRCNSMLFALEALAGLLLVPRAPPVRMASDSFRRALGNLDEAETCAPPRAHAALVRGAPFTVLGARGPDNTVLLSLLGRAGGHGTGGTRVERRKDAQPQVLTLVDEMGTRGLKLSSAALAALTDEALTVGSLQETLMAARRTGACETFGAARWRPRPRPPSIALASLPELPRDDDSWREAAAAGAAGALATGAAVAHPPAALMLPALTSGLALDRYANRGALAELLGRGLARLRPREMSEECASESAAFLSG